MAKNQEMFKYLLSAIRYTTIPGKSGELSFTQKMNSVWLAIRTFKVIRGMVNDREIPRSLYVPILTEFRDIRSRRTQQFFADKLGCSQPQVSLVLRGKRALTKEEFVDWLNVFGMHQSRTEKYSPADGFAA